MNIKQEFERTVEGKTVVCCELSTETDSLEFLEYYRLKRDYTAKDYEHFLNTIDKTYDNGYGGQKLFGYIWFSDGTWAERGGYDGSEWWSVKQCPKIPEEL